MNLRLIAVVTFTSMLLAAGACKPAVGAPPSGNPRGTSVPTRVATQCEAVGIAKGTVPAALLPSLGPTLASLAPEADGAWLVEFVADNVTAAELAWQRGQTIMLDPAHTYNLLVIRVDAATGQVTQRRATNGTLLGGPGMFPNCDP